jgi:hypothetical protein
VENGKWKILNWKKYPLLNMTGYSVAADLLGWPGN